MNIKAGDCMECGRYWTVSSGGLNHDGQCPECVRKYAVHREANDYELPHELTDELANAGAGLGV